jgi:lysozyme family protein
MQLEELSNISDNLAMMPDPALQQFAQMHKQDPYMVSLALSESNRRKKIRTAAQGQAGAAPQPKVVDAAIQGMTPAPAPAPVMTGSGGTLQTGYGGPVMTGMASGGLPEDQGIAQLPTPNMQRMADGGIAGYEDDEEGMATGGMGGMFNFAQQSEPVVRMSGGGMAGYMPGFKNTGAVNAAFEAALEKTLKYEGGYVKNDAGKGESNFGINKSANPDVDVKNLTKEKARELYKKRYWDAIGGDALAAKNPALATIAFDTAVNMGVSKASQLIAQSKGDPSAMLSLRQQHYNNLVKDNPEKFSPYAKGWKDRVADLATSVIPSAQAGELPKPAPAAAPVNTSLASQIPGYSPSTSLAPGEKYDVPASNYDQTNSFFGRMADKMGIPLEAQRQIGTTLNAPTPLAPVVRTVKSGTSGIVALGEKVADKLGFLQGPKGRMTAEEIAALQKESAGLRSLEASQKSIKEAADAADAARMSGATADEARLLSEGVEQAAAAKKAAEAAKLPSAAEKISNASLLREADDVATAQRLMKTTEQAQTAGRAESLANTVLPTDSAAANAAAGKIPFKGIDDAELERMREANQAPMTSNDIVKAAEEATPAKERKGFSNDDLLTLGLSLLASKSPNFMTALGEAGLATVAGKKEREKTAREQTMIDAELGYKKAKAKEAEAAASLIERGGKEKKMELEAEKMIQSHMSDWMKSNEGKFAGINQDGGLAKQREEDRVRTAIYASLGLPSIMRSASASSGVGLSASDSALINKYLR